MFLISPNGDPPGKSTDKPKMAGIKRGLLGQNNMDATVYSTPIAANNVLYIATKGRLFAISNQPAK